MKTEKFAKLREHHIDTLLIIREIYAARVYMYLIFMANHGVAWPGTRNIACRLKMRRQHVQRSLQTLASIGAIKKTISPSKTIAYCVCTPANGGPSRGSHGAPQEVHVGPPKRGVLYPQEGPAPQEGPRGGPSRGALEAPQEGCVTISPINGTDQTENVSTSGTYSEVGNCQPGPSRGARIEYKNIDKNSGPGKTRFLGRVCPGASDQPEGPGRDNACDQPAPEPPAPDQEEEQLTKEQVLQRLHSVRSSLGGPTKCSSGTQTLGSVLGIGKSGKRDGTSKGQRRLAELELALQAAGDGRKMTDQEHADLVTALGSLTAGEWTTYKDGVVSIAQEEVENA